MSVDKVRNVVLVGHSGNGKTSLLEAMLLRAGLINRLGRVEDGSTVGDYDVDEKSHGHSLALSTAQIEWNGYTVNVIDTPGHADYKGDAVMGLSAADLAVFVIDGVSGVQSQDRVLWRQAEQLKIPRMLFVNKLDRARSSFERTLGQIREAFGAHADPIEYPIGAESSFHGITDLITDEAFLYDTGKAAKAPIPEELVAKEHEEHEHLVEEVVELDDESLNEYLEGNEPSAEKLEQLLHEALDAGSVFPVLCGSATGPIGADHLLDIICKVGPAPGDLGPVLVEAGDDAVALDADPAAAAVAFVFKTRVDDFLGTLSFVRVLSGTIKLNDELVNSRTGSTERIRQLVVLNGADHRSVPSVSAGQVAAFAKLDDTATGDTLAAGQAVIAPLPALPTPVYSVVIRAAQPSNEDRLASMLKRLETEDPTLATGFDPTTRQTTLSGAGETHIQVAIDRIERAGVEVLTEPTSVAYRETLAGSVEVEGKFKKQSGGHGQFGVANVRFSPLERGAGFVFESEVHGGAIPKNLIPAVGAGIEEAMGRGGKHGFPLVDIAAVCVDGKYHSVDSSEMSFKMAGSLALRAAIDSVGTVVLEPVSELTVDVPSEHQGEVLGDLNSRRGQVMGSVPDGDMVSIQAVVPTAEVQRYAIDLRSMTGGTGAFSMTHHGYQPVAEALISRAAAE